MGLKERLIGFFRGRETVNPSDSTDLIKGQIKYIQEENERLMTDVYVAGEMPTEIEDAISRNERVVIDLQNS